MERVYGSIEDVLLHQLDADALKKGLTRSKWLSNAIELYLNQNDADNESEAEHLRTALDLQNLQIAHLKELLEAKTEEISHLRDLSTVLTAKIIPALHTSTIPLETHRWWNRFM